jgi:LytR cell envelope-related transcriptional attenuator
MHLVQEIGSYAGFAAVVGLAVLSALYFSQARDVKRLREWAGRAPERAAEEEARIAAQAQQAQTQTAQQRTAAAAGAATVVRPGGAATPPPSGVPVPPPPTLPTARPAGAGSSTAPSTPILGNMRERNPWYRRIQWPAPRYIALIVVGVLVIGAGAAYGISQLSKSSGSDNSAVIGSSSGSGSGSGGSSQSHHRRVAALNPKSITVAVLNGTTITGLAATFADKVEQEGFRRGNTNNALTQGQQAESVVEYADGNIKAAQLVGKKLGINQVEKIDPQTQTLAGDATVTVIVGADQAGGSASNG